MGFRQFSAPNIGPLFNGIPLQFKHVTLVFKSLHCSETPITNTVGTLQNLATDLNAKLEAELSRTSGQTVAM